MAGSTAAVIFDRDGVLLDFDLEAAAAFFRPLIPVPLEELISLWEAWGAEVGFPATVAEEQQFWEGVWEFVTEELGLPPHVNEQLRQFDYTSIMYAYPDARPALHAARRHGLGVAVLSNFSLASIGASLEAVGLSHLVDVMAAAPVIGVAKPDPAAYHHVTERLGVSPTECCFFDNKLVHVKAARAMGMDAYLVDRRRPEHDLARGVVRDLSVLERLLEGQAPAV